MDLFCDTVTALNRASPVALNSVCQRLHWDWVLINSQEAISYFLSVYLLLLNHSL